MRLLPMIVAMGAFASDKLGIDFAWYTWCFIAMGVIAILGVLRIDRQVGHDVRSDRPVEDGRQAWCWYAHHE